MRALPARRLALSALCAALLVGITGPAALAADPARERAEAAAPGAALPGADALLARVHKLETQAGPLTPVVDLMEAALRDRNTLTRAEVRKLGDAAKDALRRAAADEQPVVTLVPTDPAAATATGVLLPAADTELTDDLLGGLLDLLGGILDLLLPGLTEEAADATTDTTDDTAVEATEDVTAEDAAEDAADAAVEAAADAAEAAAEDAAENAAEDALADTELESLDSLESFDSIDEFIDKLLAEVDALIEAVSTPDLAASATTTDTATSSTATTTPTVTATTLPALTP
ncbi:hypothetical protein N4P33_29290 [Streptomyces sp. 15-116A]|uniref:hypothetical protein n=1 Tax=Streptomyces sp. 15-116A TaxID=2259035 RepID=UPI0021B2A5D1|nr:hypothetical protein [Streptomyces sp. 15-116A]MCT7356211.1 hypothetical protein [Streptomyces sp. 15-116A]